MRKVKIESFKFDASKEPLSHVRILPERKVSNYRILTSVSPPSKAAC